MCSYQQVNNSYGCQNSYLMNYLLKGELGFQGFIMSDWSAQHSGVSSSLAGLDMTMPGDVAFDSNTSYWGPNMTISILNGTIPQWRLDDQVVRIMAAYYYVGRDTHRIDVNFNSWSRDVYGYQHAFAQEGYGQINYQVNVRNGHSQLIRAHAAASTVLLKNVNGTLPLKDSTKLTAVFGEDAGDSTYGPNSCADHGCDNGTLAMGWGSGTASFPYLISPLTAIQNQVATTDGLIEWVTDNWAIAQIQALAARAQTSLVFVNADSGEGYISVDGNEGDRNNLTLWQNGETLIETVAGACNNTIVVIHSTGPVIMEPWVNHPNVTAVVYAGLPGEQSGNSITDILYGRVNPGGKLPFTVAKQASDYGTNVLYQPNNGQGAPQDKFSEGIFIDYRHFDQANITPTYEFGYGLSYTSFKYSNLQIQPYTPVPYSPNTGNGQAAPEFGSIDNDTSAYLFPSNWTYISAYIYPWLNSTDLRTASQDPQYGSDAPLPPGVADGSPQPKIRAGGAPGGNPRLYDVVYQITATVTNTGPVAGDEVAQLYISLGGSNNAPRVLRGFDRLKNIPPGGSAVFVVDVCRRDVMNWGTDIQDWFLGPGDKTVYVGGSSRDLPLSAVLPSLTS
jgi:beta-glucosidase